MGLDNVKDSPKVEMTIEVPDSWHAWTSEEQNTWI